MERFGRSLAQLAAVPGPEMEVEKAGVAEEAGETQTAAAAPPSTANRWAALRGFISATMEQHGAFVGTGSNA